MEFATKGYAQFVERFKSMTPAARIAGAGLLIVAVASVAYLFNQQAADSHIYLMGGEQFSTIQLGEMQAAFGKAGLEAEIDGTRIKVPRGQESKYMAALANAEALPAEFGQYMQKAVNAGGLLRVPHSQQEAAWRVAKQQELQCIIGEMDGIEKVAVQIDERETDDFPRKRKSITAAVMVRPQNGHPLDVATVRTIQQMVASSVAGLEPDTVTVVDLGTRRHFAAGHDIQPADAATLAGIEARETQKIEQLIANQLPRDGRNAASGSQVAVPTFRALSNPASARQELREQAIALFREHWRAVSLVGLALVGLLVLRSMLRSISGNTRPRQSGAAVDLPQTLPLARDAFEEPAPHAIRGHLEQRAERGASLSSELASAVQDDPDAAVSVLRTWIGNAN